MATEAEELHSELVAEKVTAKRKRTLTVRRWVLIVAAGIGMVLGYYVVSTTHTVSRQQTALAQQQTALLADAATIKNLTAQNLSSQNNHHAATAKIDAQLAAALADVKAEAEAIEYEGGVIIFQNAELKAKDDEIIAAQGQGHALQEAVLSLQQEINQDVPELKLGLNNGQAQINTFLHWLGCVGTNPTNATTCGAEPPLPSTT